MAIKEQNKNVINVFEAFAGIGAQHQAIKNINKFTENKFKVLKTSEWDARAIISYSRLHHEYDIDQVLNRSSLRTEKDLNKWLKNYDFSLNSKTLSKMKHKDFDFKKALIAANITNNNLPNICKVKGKDINNVDLLVYSFPCQGLSIANMGRDKGIKNENSTSNLIWQIKRILHEAKTNNKKLPKYLLLENVTQLVSDKYINDYLEWNQLLEKEFGYKTFYYKLDAIDFGMVQKRRRLYAISILKPKKKWNSAEIEAIIYKFKNNLSPQKANQEINRIFNFTPKNDEIETEHYCSIPNRTPSRMKMAKNNKDINKNTVSLSTLTTKQDRHPNIGMIKTDIKKKNGLNKRLITPREAYLIMGFDNLSFDKIRNLWFHENILTKESLYRQAGNSIAVKVLEAVFRTIDVIEREENEKH